MRNPAFETAILLALFAATAAAQTMDVSPNGARPSVAGPTSNFTGTVTVTPLFPPSAESNAGGGPVEFTPGDVIRTPPGVKNWHGATETISMTQIAITPSVGEKSVDWMEPVTNGQFR